jgi:hypothetical protein
VKADGVSLPDSTKTVAPVNNILHSLFESVRLTINDVPITVAPNNYPYKAYITNCLTYGPSVKSAQLSCQGWYSDMGNHMGPVPGTNTGFTERNQLFRKNYKDTAPYRPSGVTLFGRLMHDLIACETGLPPNTKVRIDLDKSENSFFLMCPSDDTEKYQFQIKNIALYVPVAQLSMPVYQEINSILTRKNEPKAIVIHYRRIEVRPISITKDKEDFYSDSLFPDSDLPCKIVLCFVDASSKNGSYSTNPFDFKRSWKIPKPTTSNVANETQEESNPSNQLLTLEKRLESKFDLLAAQFAKFCARYEEDAPLRQPTNSKGKGRGKKSKKQQSESEPGASTSVSEADINAEAQRRLELFLKENEISSISKPNLPPRSHCTRSSFHSVGAASMNNDFMTDDLSLSDDDAKIVYIKKIEVSLNQTPLDQVADKQRNDLNQKQISLICSNFISFKFKCCSVIFTTNYTYYKIQIIVTIISEDECMQAYWRFFTMNGQMNTLHSNGISYEEFRY